MIKQFKLVKLKKKKKYCPAWEKGDIFKGWLQQSIKHPNKAYCKRCKKELISVVTTLRKRKMTTCHKAKEGLHGPKPQSIDSIMHVCQQRKGAACTNAEIRMAVFVAEHNFSFNITYIYIYIYNIII